MNEEEAKGIKLFTYQRGVIAKVDWNIPIFKALEQPLYDRREFGGKVYYLAYWRESDGAMPSWIPEERVSIESDDVISEEKLFADIAYPGTLDKRQQKTKQEINDQAELAWASLVTRSR